MSEIIIKKYKICSICKESLFVSDFYKNKTTKDGLQTKCKSCSRKMNKKYVETNRELYNEYARKYYSINKEKIKKNTNRKKYEKEYALKNKDKIKKYKTENKDAINKQRRLKYKNDYIHRLKCLIRSRISNGIDFCKSKNTQEIIGCSYEQLFLNLNLNSFENPSHDHIIPFSWAETEEEVYALARWENLKGMEFKDNKEKSNKYCLVNEAKYVLKNHPNPKIIKLILNRANLNKDKYER